MTLDDCTDYIILKVTEDGTLAGGASLNLLKLQKLTYYAQAWHLALHERPLFVGSFEAWVHGPVSRDLYRRFVTSKTMYQGVARADIKPGFDPLTLDADEKMHIDMVLEAYAGLTGSQLEELSHREDPWTKARGALPASQPCTTVIDENVMRTFYKSQLKQT